MNYNTELQSNNVDLQGILDAVNALPKAGGEQANPVISVNTSGLITATAGTKTSTHQLAFQAAKTITPSTASQIAVSSGYYTGGAVTVTGDSNLVAGNIKSGVSIFGVSGTYAGSGSGTNGEDNIVMRNFTTYTNDRVSYVGNYAFAYYASLTSVNFPACTKIYGYAFERCSNLTSLSFPQCTSIGNYAFSQCSKLTSVNFPACTYISSRAFYSCSNLTSATFPECSNIGSYAFDGCSKLISVSFPQCTSVMIYAFYGCRSLTSISLPMCTTLSSGAFYYCNNLSTIYLGASKVCTLNESSVFYSTSIGSNKGYIYVPSSLLTSYKTATNWTYFSNRIYSYTF